MIMTTQDQNPSDSELSAKDNEKSSYESLLQELNNLLSSRQRLLPAKVKRTVQGPRSSAKFMGVSPNCQKMSKQEQRRLLEEVKHSGFITFDTPPRPTEQTSAQDSRKPMTPSPSESRKTSPETPSSPDAEDQA